MKKLCLVLATLLLSASAASAATTIQKWNPGWDNLVEPLNYSKSSVGWSVNSATRNLSVTFTLVSATPSKAYQVGIAFFCTTFPASFGQFPTDTGVAGNCTTITRRDVTESQRMVKLGVVKTDIHGDGSLTVEVGPIAAGAYVLEFMARDGAGCGLSGDVGKGSDCKVDFQSPGPFRTAARITLP